MYTLTRHAIWVLTTIAAIAAVQAQVSSVRNQVEALELATLSRGRVTTHYSAGEKVRAEHFARLSEDVAAFYETELGISFTFDAVVLSSNDWIQPYGADMPYGIPWCSVAERIVFIPSSLQEGVLIESKDLEDRHMVDAVFVHELGHLINKAYFHPDSSLEEFPIPWFEELLANYLSYRYAEITDTGWAESFIQRSRRGVASYTPSVLSLDWSFMRDLPGPVVADTYGWYQYLLNLRAADLHSEYGEKFLPALKAELPIQTLGDWNTESLLDELESIAPGFHQWVIDLENGSVL
jgi:hypothetical protein